MTPSLSGGSGSGVSVPSGSSQSYTFTDADTPDPASYWASGARAKVWGTWTPEADGMVALLPVDSEDGNAGVSLFFGDVPNVDYPDTTADSEGFVATGVANGQTLSASGEYASAFSFVPDFSSEQYLSEVYVSAGQPYTIVLFGGDNYQIDLAPVLASFAGLGGLDLPASLRDGYEYALTRTNGRAAFRPVQTLPRGGVLPALARGGTPLVSTPRGWAAAPNFGRFFVVCTSGGGTVSQPAEGFAQTLPTPLLSIDILPFLPAPGDVSAISPPEARTGTAFGDMTYIDVVRADGRIGPVLEWFPSGAGGGGAGLGLTIDFGYAVMKIDGTQAYVVRQTFTVGPTDGQPPFTSPPGSYNLGPPSFDWSTPAYSYGADLEGGVASSGDPFTPNYIHTVVGGMFVVRCSVAVTVDSAPY